MEPASSTAATQPAGDDDSFLSRFELCTLPESDWTHLAHVRVAWLYLTHQSSDEALRRICDGILSYNTEVLHRPEKYSETITVAFTHIVLGRMRTTESWGSFATRIDDLLDPKTPILLNHYSKERLFSDAARTQFVEPDVTELPCRDVFDLAPGYSNGRAQN
jgi:hypothetical protein